MLLVLSPPRSNSILSTHQELAFDPVFWLHHCNVDRQLSLWSAINPDIWVEPDDSGEVGTRTIKPNTEIGENTGK